MRWIVVEPITNTEPLHRVVPMLEPGYREELVGLASELGIADRLHLMGYQPDPRRWMEAFDVVVHASDNEPFGLVC